MTLATFQFLKHLSSLFSPYPIIPPFTKYGARHRTQGFHISVHTFRLSSSGSKKLNELKTGTYRIFCALTKHPRSCLGESHANTTCSYNSSSYQLHHSSSPSSSRPYGHPPDGNRYNSASLIAMICVVKVFLALVLRRFRTPRIHVGSRHLQCIYIDGIQDIGEISRDYQLISRKYKNFGDRFLVR